MIIPIRCITCGRPVGHQYEEFKERSKTQSSKEVLDDLKITRYCCRSLMLGHVDLIDLAAKFKRF